MKHIIKIEYNISQLIGFIRDEEHAIKLSEKDFFTIYNEIINHKIKKSILNIVHNRQLRSINHRIKLIKDLLSKRNTLLEFEESFYKLFHENQDLVNKLV